VPNPIVMPRVGTSPAAAATCPLCDHHAGSFIADHRGLPRRELRQGYHCGSCGARFTVPTLEDQNLRRRSRADREAVAQAVRREWSRGVTVNLDKETFRRLLAEDAVA
jgi:transcriptional regulator NrdR family protein